MDDIAFIRKFYEEHLKKYGKDDIRAMGWHEEDEYSIRFEVVTTVGDLHNASILDVGCGFGGLYKHLISEKVKNFSYLGVDILPKMIDIAKEKNPTGKFEVKDILKDRMSRVDYVFCIGSLNITTKNFDEYFRKILKKLISLAKKAVVVSFLSKPHYLVSGSYHFEDPHKLKPVLEKEYGVSIEIIEDKRLSGESCLFVRKKSSL
ncbi:class I SAM-dependent methyltransferase [Candidatus Woesearchaeota archaeon]|nr:class I SAM-dependent methyltransferase [Candidatus Woesearchaeota archaeon]